MNIDNALKPTDLNAALKQTFQLAEKKALQIDKTWDEAKGTPVFTVEGQYTTRGWTEWTQGFQYGCAILAYEQTGSKKLLDIGRTKTLDRMATHVSHIGVHDHGFNNLSTYGNLRRLMLEKTIPMNEWEMNFYELAIKCSGAVQASRWNGCFPVKSSHTANAPTLGYIYSFNGPHSLFVDTMRSCRILSMAWKLGHVLMHEGDKRASLLKRCVLHGLATSQFIVFHGEGEHTYDIAGRTAHEAIFNRNDGAFRCRSSQQGYSPFSTWTRGLAWAILGYAEELEFFKSVDAKAFHNEVGLAQRDVVRVFEKCAKETADHYINDVTAADGVPYWDDGAPGLAYLGEWQKEASDPYNDHEPIDSSAAAIAAQGLIRLGKYLGGKGSKYVQAGLTIAKTLMAEPYLSTSSKHQGLLLHSIYHRPNGWDHVPEGSRSPNGESSLWGDYHLLELALLVSRLAKSKYHTFFQ